MNTNEKEVKLGFKLGREFRKIEKTGMLNKEDLIEMLEFSEISFPAKFEKGICQGNKIDIYSVLTQAKIIISNEHEKNTLKKEGIKKSFLYEKNENEENVCIEKEQNETSITFQFKTKTESISIQVNLSENFEAKKAKELLEELKEYDSSELKDLTLYLRENTLQKDFEPKHISVLAEKQDDKFNKEKVCYEGTELIYVSKTEYEEETGIFWKANYKPNVFEIIGKNFIDICYIKKEENEIKFKIKNDKQIDWLYQGFKNISRNKITNFYLDREEEKISGTAKVRNLPKWLKKILDDEEQEAKDFFNLQKISQ